jgi:glyoxylase-like metal-dependent hydrolase (beta-lactamase superfamily II)/rhodanese-related sulfurtransferase
MIFKQFNFEGCLSYIISGSKDQQGVIIDPSHEMNPYIDFIKSNDLHIRYVIDTHTHVDHLSLAEELADIVGAKTVMYANTPEQRKIGSTVKELFGIEKIIEINGKKRVDLMLNDGEKLVIGDLSFRVLYTPGHTRDAMCLVAKDRIFTGDTLFIGQCGRTDLPGGSARDMHESLFKKIFPLSDDFLIYPAHDYNGNINSSLGYEKKNNLCLKTQRTVEELTEFLKGLFPPLDSGGAKLQCGLKMTGGSGGDAAPLNPVMHTFCLSMEQHLLQPREAIIITPATLSKRKAEGDAPYLLDVREPEELSSEGYIRDAVNIPVNQVAARVGEVPGDLDQPIVTICASGVRSAYAALYLRAYGYRDVKGLEYGMRGWKAEGYPVIYPA